MEERGKKRGRREEGKMGKEGRNRKGEREEIKGRNEGKKGQEEEWEGRIIEGSRQ